ncbi:hypothetical protein EVG20_g11596 [Dentipellis fragilis]|uniref:Uncharacterized protein n=1 Tax=Dentipellis fragilis TaxID=205917 RepID=A0A4Y9XK26_9AGAM|nr:hypothetical protein EVG20_g11596 [Dentipellis fragilis]
MDVTDSANTAHSRLAGGPGRSTSRAPSYVAICAAILRTGDTDLCLTQFTVFICVLFVLPTARPVTAQNMNYAIVAVGGIIGARGARVGAVGRATV